jgi:mannose-6-phosphate isomerase
MTANVSILTPFVQNYEWGRLGSNSVVAQLAHSGAANPFLDESRPYAELWMGHHPNGPCFVGSVPVGDWLAGRPLPFLLKVLSIRKSLSIQSHPDKGLAATLHQTRPDVYRDPNDKPELAIALTQFEALFGFRPIGEIAADLSRIRGLESLGSALRESGDLKSVYPKLFEFEQLEIIELINSIIADPSAPHRDLVYRLNSEYPGGDIGVLSALFLNYVTLSPGECLFIGPNTPHAYLSGDCVECMTSSDNVIRGGLTPKYIDVQTLIDSLEYSGRSPALLEPVDGVYRPASDVPFAVRRVPLGRGERIQVDNGQGVAIGIVIDGQGSVGGVSVTRGMSVMISGRVEINSDNDKFEIFIAFNPN